VGGLTFSAGAGRSGLVAVFQGAGNSFHQMSNKASRNFFDTRRKAKPIHAEMFESRAIDPSKSLEDWLEWLKIVRYTKSNESRAEIKTTVRDRCKLWGTKTFASARHG